MAWKDTSVMNGLGMPACRMGFATTPARITAPPAGTGPRALKTANHRMTVANARPHAKTSPALLVLERQFSRAEIGSLRSRWQNGEMSRFFPNVQKRRIRAAGYLSGALLGAGG